MATYQQMISLVLGDFTFHQCGVFALKVRSLCTIFFLLHACGSVVALIVKQVR